MSVLTRLPKFIYKILPSDPLPPTPLPLSLPVSALDSRDNFVHLSTSSQILGTLLNFFKAEKHVHILRIPYERVEKWVKWEDATGKQPDEAGGCWDVEGSMAYFPHVHGNGLKIGRDEVDQMGVWKRGEGWSVEGWPFEVDRPKGSSS